MNEKGNQIKVVTILIFIININLIYYIDLNSGEMCKYQKLN